MRIGSLFSGAGGLDLAVEQVFGGRTVWHCEVDPAASKVLAHRWPGVPNLGDITEINWNALRFHIDDVPDASLKVGVLCGGFPCQDVSAAGRRAGLQQGTRSGLWAMFAAAVAALHPQFVVIENVRGLLSARAHRAMESGDAAMGGPASGPVLRAAGAVLGDLADLGYDAQWTTVSAASVGAPHKRERVFILATAADAARHGRNQGWPEPARIVGGSDAALGGDGPIALLPTPQARDYKGGNATVRDGGGRRPVTLEDTTRARGEGGASDLATVACLLPTPAASRSGRNRSASDGAAIRPSLDSITGLLPTPEARDGKGANPNRQGGHDLPGALLPTPSAQDGNGGGRFNSDGHQSTLPGSVRETENWGKYAPAIARWEAVTRPAPAPTEPNTKGNPRLAPAFPEWMQGWPAGWVTAVPGISRNDMLRIIGNGVCPQQAAAALWQLLTVCEAAA